MRRGGGEGVRIRDHLANVRTLLAWQRIALVLLGLGYVVARFQVVVTGRQRVLGVAVAVAGWAVGAIAAARYLRQRNAIEHDRFEPSVVLDLVLVGVTAGAGIVVLGYLSTG